MTILGDATLTELADAIRGDVIRPRDDGYDEARKVWNGTHDRHPALIVRCHDVDDVVQAVRFARSEHLLVAVRGGAHSLPGFSTVDDGIVIDLSPMQTVEVDAARGTALAQAGATWNAFDAQTQEHGLAVTGGLVSSTGIAGFTLGGGIGWLMRKHGLTCDNVIAAELVTADGTLVRASADENPELFWGLRGGGGNFGIVTAFEYRVHPVGPEMFAGAIFYPGELAGDILRFYREWAPSAPDDITTVVSLATAPPAPFLPEEWHGRQVAIIPAAYAGDPAAGERIAKPLRELGEPVADLLGPMPYQGMQQLLDPMWGPGAHNYFKAGWLRGLDDDAIDTLTRYHRDVSSPKSEIHIHQMGGAVSRVPADATAFGDRSAPFLLNVIASTFTAEGYTDAVGWARDLHAAMEPALTGGTYVNFVGDAGGGAELRAAYGDKLDRLVALKDRWDPSNLFRLNQNIPPSR